jgi:hypothetical protein
MRNYNAEPICVKSGTDEELVLELNGGTDTAPEKVGKVALEIEGN